MNPRWTTLLASVWLTFAAAGDVIVNFRNDVLPGRGKVVFGQNPYGFALGSPVVNGYADKYFVAQLYWRASQADCLPRPVGAPVNFQSVAFADPLAGTWLGEDRIIVGPPSDAVVLLEVWMWDAAYPSFAAAVAADAICNHSSPFTYRNKLSDPPKPADTYMDNFVGFTTPALTPLRIVEPALFALIQSSPPLPELTLSLGENDSLAFHPAIAATSAEAAVNGSWHRPKGRIAGSGTNLTYFAPTNYYGLDAFELALSGDIACNRPQRVNITTQPSPARTRGQLSVGTALPNDLLFLGLTNRTYQLQASPDLFTWSSLGNVTGTLDPIKLTDRIPNLGNETFVRLVELSP